MRSSHLQKERTHDDIIAILSPLMGED